MLAVFTPTYRFGGLDVLESSLKRQTYKDFFWIVADELLEERMNTWREIAKRNTFRINLLSLEKEENKKRNLCDAYNSAIVLAKDLGADLMVSLQDYIWINEDGLKKFVWLYEKKERALLTGVTHISKDPWPHTINNLNGHYSLWEEPYSEKPKRILWKDSRIEDIYQGFPTDSVINIRPDHWETNWAAIPTKVIEDGLFWDEEYDYGIAYENADFARRAEQKEYQILFDTSNIAISLPHKNYFDGEREEIEKFSNRKRYEDRWMHG